MRHFNFLILVLLSAVASTAIGDTSVTISTYNIKFLDAEKLPSQGDRESKLEAVIAQLDSDVIALQEIDDRTALKRIFSVNQWHLVIDDDSGSTQDVALAVKKHLNVRNMSANLDADDEDFLFEGSQNNSFFPNRRDVLAVEIEVPDEEVAFTAMVMHTKSRHGGRHTTEPRRIGSSVALVQRLEQDFDGDRVVVLGDFNDTPDDRSLNILETGNANAGAGADTTAGPFLVNLTEPLYDVGHVTFGRNTSDISGDSVNTVDSEARTRNLTNLGNDSHTGDQMFDQILVSPELHAAYVEDSVEVFNGPDAARGNNTSRASDHLPVSATFLFVKSDPPSAPDIRIASLLPNPDGKDAGNETVSFANSTNSAIDLAGWSIADLANNTRQLSGSVPANGEHTFKLLGKAMLNNSGGGDVITLFDPTGTAIDVASYTANQVVSGVPIQIN